jgi:hypothetical protein
MQSTLHGDGLGLAVVRLAPLLVLAILPIAGCETTPRSPPPPDKITMTCGMPTFAALPQTKEYQVKGGIAISVAANIFQCNVTNEVVETELTPGPLDSLALLGQPNPDFQHYKKVQTVTTPVFNVTPNRVSFKLKITNQGARVFRGAGTVLLYNVSGKNLSVSQHDYDGLTNLIVPPRTGTEVDVYGPPFTELGPQTTIALFLYDVVTKTDAAGNVTEKQNFEWYYNYAVQTKEQVGEVVHTTSFRRR